MEREIKLAPPKYFDQRLLNLNYYNFFVQFQKHFREQVLIATKKKIGNFRADMFNNDEHLIEALANKDQGFYFMNQIRGTPVYWKKIQYDLLVMIKQLGCPTFFLTLSCADLKRQEMPEMFSKV